MSVVTPENMDTEDVHVTNQSVPKPVISMKMLVEKAKQNGVNDDSSFRSFTDAVKSRYTID